MNALDRLNAIAATRALTDEESARLSYLVKYYSRDTKQREQVNANKRVGHARRADEINAARRERYAKEWLHAEKRRFENRVSYRRRVGAA
jgi:hypothetical protein